MKEKIMLNKMTWPEAKEKLKSSKLVIIPLGSFEQHGKHLPLETDYLLALERTKLIAQRVEAVVAPIIRLGCSEHHLGFHGTISLSEDTFVKILLDVAISLNKSGIEKLVLLSGHGGNKLALSLAVNKINKKTDLSAVLFGVEEIKQFSPSNKEHEYDLHAGVQETAAMYIYSPEDIREDEIEKPIINFDKDKIKDKWGPEVEKKLYFNNITSIKDVSSNGVLSYSNPSQGKDFVPKRHEMEDNFINYVVKFIKAWNDKDIN